jgi:hypothetical protein
MKRGAVKAPGTPAERLNPAAFEARTVAAAALCSRTAFGASQQGGLQPFMGLDDPTTSEVPLLFP